MHRLITALMALVSLLAANLYPAGAQQSENRQAVPAAVGQGPHPNANLSEQALRPLSFPPEQPREKSGLPHYELAADHTLPYLVARDKTLFLAGHVTGDVLTINCHVVIKPGASVGNVLTAVGGDVIDENQGRVRYTQLSGDLASELEATAAVSAPAPIPIQPQNRAPEQPKSPAPRDKPKDDWAGGQFALMLLGGLAGALALIVAPRAAERTGESLTREPGRCLVVGVLGSGAMLVGLWFSSGLMRSPFHFIWLPFAAGFAGLCLGALAFGWICGMRYIGQRFAHRFGRAGGIGMWIQIAMGLGAFFLVNAGLGRINQGLGIVGLLLEFALALAGLGAALLTGFGADQNWLTARMRGETRWLSRNTRL